MINKAAQATLSITGPLTKTVGDAAFAPAVTGGSTGGAVTFTSTTPAVCAASATRRSRSSRPAPARSPPQSPATPNYLSVTSAAFGITIDKAAQNTLTITGPTSATYGAAERDDRHERRQRDGPSPSTRGTSTACSIVAGKLHVLAGTGTCTITATKAGDADYEPTTSAAFPVTINKAAQATLSITGPSTRRRRRGLRRQLSTGGSGGGGDHLHPDDAGRLRPRRDSTVAIVTAGTCTITATKAADANYLVTTSAPFGITIDKAAQDDPDDHRPDERDVRRRRRDDQHDGRQRGRHHHRSTRAPRPPARSWPASSTSSPAPAPARSPRPRPATPTTSRRPRRPSRSRSTRPPKRRSRSPAPRRAAYGVPRSLSATTGGSGSGAISFSAGSSSRLHRRLARPPTISAGTGTCTITATKAADANYAQSRPRRPSTSTVDPAPDHRHGRREDQGRTATPIPPSPTSHRRLAARRRRPFGEPHPGRRRERRGARDPAGDPQRRHQLRDHVRRREPDDHEGAANRDRRRQDEDVRRREPAVHGPVQRLQASATPSRRQA